MNMPMTLPVRKVGTIKWYDLYGKFADYSNSLAAMAREKGLQPMAFNDGFYYGDEDDVAFDKDVLISTGLKDGGL